MCSPLLLSCRFFSWKSHFLSVLEKSITPTPESQLENQAVCIIKHQCDSPTVPTQQLAQQQHVPWCISYTKECSHMVHCGWWGFLKMAGAILRTLMLEGDPEVPFTSPSAISLSHMASALAEQSGRPACGRESGPRNLYPQSNANFQFNTLVRVWAQLNCCRFKDGFCNAVCASSVCIYSMPPA